MQGVALRHVKRYCVAGKVYWYHRETGERLSEDADDRAARVLHINATLDGWRGAAVPGSIGELIGRYKASPDFTRLAPSTRRGYGTYLGLLERCFADDPVSGIDRAWLYKVRDSMADAPRAADLLLSILSILLGFAVDRGWRADNPAVRIRKLRGGKSYEPWPEAAIARFRAGADKRMVWAMELALYTGQRQSDVLAMQWHHIEDGLISVAQQKTGERLAIPIHRDLASVLDAIPRGHLSIVHTARGAPYTPSGFRASFRKTLARLGLAGLQFHGLRHTAGQLLAEAGATDRELMAILGHRTAAMVTRYTRKADQERLARSAIVKLETRTGVSKAPDRAV